MEESFEELIYRQLPSAHKKMLLMAARALVSRGAEQGMECPCCSQFVKIYRRKLNSGMAATLVWLVKYYKAHGYDWVHVQRVAPRYVIRSNEIGKLVHWDLVEMKIEPGEDGKDKRTSGLWKPKDSGIDFAERSTLVPARVYLYNNKVIGFDSEKIDIVDALGSKFNYRELMDG